MQHLFSHNLLLSIKLVYLQLYAIVCIYLLFILYTYFYKIINYIKDVELYSSSFVE
jgi:hypothetical protein